MRAVKKKENYLRQHYLRNEKGKKYAHLNELESGPNYEKNKDEVFLLG